MENADAALEASLSRVSLTSESLSPRLSPNGHISPQPAPEEEGDIGYAISPARSPPLRGLRSREFTPLSSPSPSSSRQRHSQSRDAVPSSSRPASTSRSSSSNRFPASHPAHLSPPSPPPRFVPYKSPLPINTMSLNGLESPTDISAPFESIPLQPSPPSTPS